MPNETEAAIPLGPAPGRTQQAQVNFLVEPHFSVDLFKMGEHQHICFTIFSNDGPISVLLSDERAEQLAGGLVEGLEQKSPIFKAKHEIDARRKVIEAEARGGPHRDGPFKPIFPHEE